MVFQEDSYVSSKEEKKQRKRLKIRMLLLAVGLCYGPVRSIKSGRRSRIGERIITGDAVMVKSVL